MKAWWLVPGILVAAGAIASACAMTKSDDVRDTQAVTSAACGESGQTCCAAPQKACVGELGCAAGRCASITTNMVAYTEHCKEELGFTNPRAKLPYLSCFDSVGEDGSRMVTAKQAEIQLTLREDGTTRTLKLLDNGPAVHAGKDVWDNVFGSGSADGLGCDNPNYLSNVCDPYYRLNVFKPDPGNRNITAAIHCRDTFGAKPSPATAISAEARKRAYLDAPADATDAEKDRLFRQYNDTNEIVLIMANSQSGKACFFHVEAPYFGTHFPAPDNEQDVTQPEVVDRIWNELPVRPPFAKDDATRQREWLRNGTTGYKNPSAMACTTCHDSGPWMHNPFIDSMDLLPTDRASRPYIPLPQSYHGDDAKFVKTDAVKVPGQAEPQRQVCTSCHSIGDRSSCNGWLNRATGWSYPTTASAESQTDPKLGRYMPHEHDLGTKEDYYREYGPHLDALKCCCEHADWKGCRRVDRENPGGEGTRGENDKSCVDSTTGGWHQACDSGACNHSALTCRADRCVFRDE